MQCRVGAASCAGLLVLMSAVPRSMSRRQRLWGAAIADKLASVLLNRT